MLIAGFQIRASFPQQTKGIDQVISNRWPKLPLAAHLALKLKMFRRDWRDRRLLQRADVVIVSFPKSGRTWIRVMLSKVCHLSSNTGSDAVLEFDNLQKLDASLPIIHFTHAGDAMRTPEEITEVSKSLYPGKKIVVLVRHPADIAVSRFHHLKYRSTDPARKQLAARPLGEFVWTDQGGIPSIVKYLNVWTSFASNNTNAIVVRYEDFSSAPETALSRMATHIGIHATAAHIREAIADASFDKMKKAEISGQFANSRLKPRQQNDERTQKVRRGKAGGWRDSFSPTEIEKIQHYISANLDPQLGYRE